MYSRSHFNSTGGNRQDKISKVYANHNESYLLESSSINLPSPRTLKYVNEPPSTENYITIDRNFGLNASINNIPYELGKVVFPKSDVNKLIYAVSESFAYNKLLEFIFAVIANKGFWAKFSGKLNEGTRAVTSGMKKLRKLFKRKSKSANKKKGEE